MIALGIETSAAIGGVALTDDGKILSERTFEKGLVHGREVVPAIKSVTEEAKIPLNRIDLVAVDVGPGSYTGVRVGVSVAKTLAWALGKKLAAVVSLDALAEAAKELGPTIIPVLDARRCQLYSATYRVDSAAVTRKSGPAVAELAGFLDSIDSPAVLLGDAIKRFPQEFAPREGIIYAPEEFWIPKASIIARLGLLAARQSLCEERSDEAISSSRLADPVTLEPLYLRPSEAEQKLGIRIDPASTKPEKRL